MFAEHEVTPPPTPARTTANAAFCFARYDNWNPLWGLILNRPQHNVYFFGKMERGVEDCERHCFNEPGCWAFAYYTSSYENSSLAGLCYGRGRQPTVLYYIPEANVVGGFLKQSVGDYCDSTRSVAPPGESSSHARPQAVFPSLVRLCRFHGSFLALQTSAGASTSGCPTCRSGTGTSRSMTSSSPAATRSRSR